MIRSIALVLFSAVCISASVAGQPDRAEVLEKAKAKFEKDVAKLEDTLIAGIDKSIAKAQSATNKPLLEKLTYERDMFVKIRLTPTAYSADTYLRQRAQAIAALNAVYHPAIAELTKAKKLSEAAAVEDELSDLVKASRGYGLALPDLESKPIFLIENKTSGLVIETMNKGGTGDLVLGAKVGKNKLSQCWRLERDEKGYYIHNCACANVIQIPGGSRAAGTMITTWGFDPRKESDARSVFQFNEVRREIAMECVLNGLILTATEKKLKGVSTTYVTQEKKEEPPTSAQLWTFIEAK
jgi:Ricin-type beta-trefoil lectin domain-like